MEETEILTLSLPTRIKKPGVLPTTARSMWSRVMEAGALEELEGIR
jgi:hypothetical protein